MAGEAKAPGRPSDFTQEIADDICLRLMDGESLRTICLGDDMPNRATVHRWLNAHESFSDQYARARSVQADTLADEILDIADDASRDSKSVGREGEEHEVCDTEFVQRSRLRIDSRKWLAGKLAPKKYGDKVALTGGGDDDKPLTVVIRKPE